MSATAAIATPPPGDDRDELMRLAHEDHVLFVAALGWVLDQDTPPVVTIEPAEQADTET